MAIQPKHVFASLPLMERGVAKVLGGDPKGNNFLYTNGKSVIIRNIDNPSVADIYTEHTHQVTVAKYSPSGFYIASGDVVGKIRIWDTTQKEHLLKYEYQPFAGRIRDIAWTEDSKRMAVVGEGREKFGSVFLWDSGSSVGELGGHSKSVNSVDLRPVRPYRLISGGDDSVVAFSEGPPFQFKFTLKDHINFVNCVRFSPDGSLFATAGAGGMIVLFDGKTGEKVRVLGEDKAHSGGVYAVCWNSDSSQLMSASGDKTVKLWDVSSGAALLTFNMGNDVGDMQLGCLWQKDHLISVSLSGNINYLDRNNPDKPLRIVKGHSKSVHCLTTHKSDGRTTIYSASHDGHINYWDSDTGDNDCLRGKGHTNQVSKMVVDENNQLISCGMDDTVRFTDLKTKEYSASAVVKMDSQPKCVSTAPGGLTLVVCIDLVVLLKDKKKVFTLDKLDYEPETAALHPGGTTAVVGGADGKVRMYSVQGGSLKDEGRTLEATGKVTAMAFSNDGAYLAVTDEKKVLRIFTVADNYAIKDDFYGHHAKVVSVAWSPDNEHLATSGIDMMVYIWTISDSNKLKKITDAHRMHHVTSLAWVDTNTLVTTSFDACIKQWSILY
ncbi:hypothetical protein NHX12_030689 [Muraenolepis orangiensis]|uniref:WD repeat-containing protein 1 n=1 Tax=Muraenolepis orangiensis TaxID=630683 RepID=A0A9Q0ECJ7_9TELE|nr:hypothetical protein NHX12_030689 [Muraenolepis orangiensis]